MNDAMRHVLGILRTRGLQNATLEQILELSDWPARDTVAAVIALIQAGEVIKHANSCYTASCSYREIIGQIGSDSEYLAAQLRRVNARIGAYIDAIAAIQADRQDQAAISAWFGTADLPAAQVTRAVAVYVAGAAAVIAELRQQLAAARELRTQLLLVSGQ